MLGGCIPAAGFAGLADLGQALGFYGQTNQLEFVAPQEGRQAHVIEVFRGQRIIGRLDAEMQSHVKAGGCLAGARNAHQDQVRVPEVDADSVVVGQGVIGRFHAVLVAVLVGQPVRAPHRALGAHPQRLRHGLQEGLEQVENDAVTAGDDPAQVLVHDGVENQGRLPVSGAGAVDRLDRLPAFFFISDEWQADLLELDARKLGDHAVAQRLGGDGSAVRDEEDGPPHAALRDSSAIPAGLYVMCMVSRRAEWLE